MASVWGGPWGARGGSVGFWKTPMLENSPANENDTFAADDEAVRLGLDGDRPGPVEEQYRGFARAGAALSDEAKEAVRANNQERAQILSTFRRRILAEVNAAAVVVDDRALLDGLPESDIAAAAAAATARGLAGRWVLPLQNTTQQPALAYLKNRALRERLFKASIGRNAAGENDTTDLLVRLAARAAAISNLCGGWSSWL